MTTTEYEAKLEAYYDPRTDLIDANRYADEHGVNTVMAVFGPATGSPNEATYLVALEHNALTRKRGARARVRGIERAAWLRTLAGMVVALVAGLLAR